MSEVDEFIQRPDLKGRSFTLTLTALQWDMLRYACRAGAKKLQRNIKSSEVPEYCARMEERMAEMERLKAVISNALRRELGEADFNVLELAFENPRRRSAGKHEDAEI